MKMEKTTKMWYAADSNGKCYIYPIPPVRYCEGKIWSVNSEGRGNHKEGEKDPDNWFIEVTPETAAKLGLPKTRFTYPAIEVEIPNSYLK